MDALHQARRDNLDQRDEDWAFRRALIEHLETIWQQPDEGIWEIRGRPRHFTYSKVMAWVALDRGILPSSRWAPTVRRIDGGGWRV
jgi:GH15 family glucan-1,4-alpha-glucosidase